MDIYVLNKDLNRIDVIDVYSSLIWAKRYYDVGDCELAVPATADNLNLLQIGYYLARPDDDMICIIKKINIKTSIENGNYLIVTGKDVKCLLYQRIVWETSVYSSKTANLITNLALAALGNTQDLDRAIVNTKNTVIFEVDSPPEALDTAETKEQISYKNVGEKIYNICRENQWGVRVYKGEKAMTPSIPCFRMRVYAGEDKTATVTFSPQEHNLAESDYSVDTSDMGNVTKIGGQGEGTARYMTDVGNATGIDRYEFFTDAKDIPNTITYRELLEAYGAPDYEGQVKSIQHGAATAWAYCIKHLEFPVYSQTQLDDLITEYPYGQKIVHGGKVIRYQAITNYPASTPRYAPIAYVSGQNPEMGSTVTMTDGFYDLYLINRGLQKIAEAGVVTSFTGTVQPYNYTYRTDYNVGDVVTVSNGYGATAQARIVEVTEVHDSNGYQTIPKFEYQEINDVYVPAPNT